MLAVMDEIALDTEKLYEIVDGQLEEKPTAGMRHGGVGMRIGIRLGLYAESNNWGRIYGPSTSFRIGPNERMPDLSLIATARIPATGETTGVCPIAPDLAVEVVSPSDSWQKVQSRIREYFAAAVRQVWIVSPEFKSVTVYRSLREITLFIDDDELTSEDLLPGFRCRLNEIFD